MSQPGQGLPAYWDEQRRMMGRRPRGRAELRETVAEAEPQPMLPKQEPEPAPPAGEGGPLGLEELRAKAERVGAWLLETDISHERWAEGLSVYAKLQEEIQALEQGLWHSLRQPAGVNIAEQAAQAPLLEPLIWLPEQQAPLLRPGWIAQLQDVLPDAGEPYEARLLCILDTRTQEGVKGSSWEQMLCLWQRLDNGQCFRQIVEIG